MSKFIDSVLAYSAKPDDYSDPLENIPALEADFGTCREAGLISGVTFRIPVTISPVLDEILLMTPYSSKGELVYVMLQSQINDFISALPDSESVLNQAAESVVDRYVDSGLADEEKDKYKEIQEELL